MRDVIHSAGGNFNSSTLVLTIVCYPVW